MNMTNFLIALAIVIVGGGAFLYLKPSEAPVSSTPQNTINTPAGNTTAGDGMPQNEMTATETSTTNDTKNGTQMTPTVTIDLTGKNYSFSKKEIRVKEGDAVAINFTSESGFHDWVVDEFNARTKQVQTGNSSSVTFVADKKGTFEYYCSVGQHRANGMFGKLIV